MKQTASNVNVIQNNVPLIQRSRVYDLSLQVFNFVESVRHIFGTMTSFELDQMRQNMHNSMKLMSVLCSLILRGKEKDRFELGDINSGEV